ncbi:MAG TPA: class I SAM-dependent methyltransferase [Solirubrobacteraceae bacterium]|nr:class I SAM-dependent methyltransferase [Solirubrobacteraceae bacterium]
MPPGEGSLPDFDGGWRRADGALDPYLSFVGEEHAVNWSDELEQLHEESSREHFLDVWTRRSMLERVGPLPAGAVIVDLGCSTGYLLEDLRVSYPESLLSGIDLVAAGLRKAHRNVPQARLLQADVCALPLEDASVDAAVSANLLEHVPDDRGALTELRRVLRPGARGVLVVPAGPSTYDYYDRFLGHERRYARGEMAAKARDAGLDVIEDVHLGSVLYPAFWLVKQRNRRRYAGLEGDALQARVAANIAGTSDSRVGRWACALERAMLNRGIRLPFGIRGLTVVRRAERDA